MSKFNKTNWAKLNCIQQDIVNMFEKEGLTRPEVFVILKGMREFKMVNRELADKWWSELRYFDPHKGLGDHPFVPEDFGEETL